MSEQNTQTLRALVDEMRAEVKRLSALGQHVTPSLQVSMWADELEAALAAEALSADLSPLGCASCGSRVRCLDGQCANCGDDWPNWPTGDAAPAPAPSAVQVRASLVAEVRREVERLRAEFVCSHPKRTGGNDYIECWECGAFWDYRREGPEASLLRRLDAILALPSLATKETD